MSDLMQINVDKAQWIAIVIAIVLGVLPIWQGKSFRNDDFSQRLAVLEERHSNLAKAQVLATHTQVLDDELNEKVAALQLQIDDLDDSLNSLSKGNQTVAIEQLIRTYFDEQGSALIGPPGAQGPQGEIGPRGEPGSAADATITDEILKELQVFLVDHFSKEPNLDTVIDSPQIPTNDADLIATKHVYEASECFNFEPTSDVRIINFKQGSAICTNEIPDVVFRHVASCTYADLKGDGLQRVFGGRIRPGDQFSWVSAGVKATAWVSCNKIDDGSSVYSLRIFQND